MPEEVDYQTERLDHLGIVVGVCREVGIATWLDARAGESRREVSVGTAVVAMILSGMSKLSVSTLSQLLDTINFRNCWLNTFSHSMQVNWKRDYRPQQSLVAIMCFTKHFKQLSAGI